MKIKPRIIEINDLSTTPKYKQIVNSVIAGIERGDLAINSKLPSVNRLLIEFDISRDTVVKAYEHLKQIGLVQSVPGKGYYICSTNYQQSFRIFLLFNKLSAHKKIIYDAFTREMGDEAAIDFFVYHNNYRLFKNWILQSKDKDYSHYVIITHFLDGGQNAAAIIDEIPPEKLILLDKLIRGVKPDCGAVYQDFEKDIYRALMECRHLLAKYERLRIIFPPYTYHPQEILTGFRRFCREAQLPYDIIEDIERAEIAPRQAFINLMEDDLVTLIKRIKKTDLCVGQDVGIISYNETPIKEILLDGITTISTDFEMLGRSAAQLILQNERRHIHNPFRLVMRQSL